MHNVGLECPLSEVNFEWDRFGTVVLVVGFPKLVVVYFRHIAMAPGVGRDCRGHFNEDSCLLVPPRAQGVMNRPSMSAMSDKAMTRSHMRTEFTIASCF